MLKSIYDLKESGIVDEKDYFTRPLNYEELTGQESGVWFDYTSGNANSYWVSCDNFSGCPVVQEYPNGSGEYVYPEIVALVCDRVEAMEIIDDDDLANMKANGAKQEDIDVLTSGDCWGAFYKIVTKDYDGEKTTLYFFAPEGWN